MRQDIKGYEGLYYAVDDGSIWSYGGKSNHKNDLMLKPSLDKDGYRRVTLQNNKHRKYFRVNRLIASTFLDNNDSLPMVNHIDKNKSNDALYNLEWVDAFTNWKHSESDQSKQMITVKKICKITFNIIEEYPSLMEAARKNNINQGNITNCLKGRCKSVGGFIWSF